MLFTSPASFKIASIVYKSEHKKKCVDQFQAIIRMKVWVT